MVWTGYEVDVKAPLHVIIDGQEYDLTAWKNYHPGGHFVLHQYALFPSYNTYVKIAIIQRSF